jgi:hypothetical protein
MVGGSPAVQDNLRLLGRSYYPVMGQLFVIDSLADAYRIIARNRPEINEDLRDLAQSLNVA